MGPIGHSTISAGIGISIWEITGSAAAGSTALGVGILNDVDHLLDYDQWYICRRQGKIYMLFHAWEYGITGLMVLGAVYYHPVLLAAVLAHLGHIATHHFHNRINPWGYSITYQALVRFDRTASRPITMCSIHMSPGCACFLLGAG